MPRLRRPDRLAKAIGERVAELREERGLTIERLAYSVDVSKGTVSDLERGLARPSIKTLKKLADGLDVELLDLFVTPARGDRHRLIDATRGLSRKAIRQLVDAVPSKSS